MTPVNRLTKAEQAVLDPVRDIAQSLLYALRGYVGDLSPEQLAALDSAVSKFDESNIWHVLYDLVILDAIAKEHRSREKGQT